MLNEIVVPIYNVFKLGKGSLCKEENHAAVWSWTNMIIVASDTYITNQLVYLISII